MIIIKLNLGYSVITQLYIQSCNVLCAIENSWLTKVVKKNLSKRCVGNEEVTLSPQIKCTCLTKNLPIASFVD